MNIKMYSSGINSVYVIYKQQCVLEWLVLTYKACWFVCKKGQINISQMKYSCIGHQTVYSLFTRYNNVQNSMVRKVKWVRTRGHY